MSPARRKWKTEELGLAASFDALRLFRVEQPSPFVLAVYRAYRLKQIALKTLKRAITAVENFHFAFTAITSSRSSGGISQMYARHACGIAGLVDSQDIAREIDELLDKLKDKRPNREEFINEFRRLKASERYTREKPLVQYALHRFSEHHLTLPLERARMTIEHLASQSGRGHPLAPEAVAEIGNLAWVGQSTQDKLGTKSLHDKLRIMQHDGFWTDESLKNHQGNWDAPSIRTRTDHLGGLAYDEVWRIL